RHGLAALGELLEAPQVAAHAAVHEAEGGADVLHEALGVVLDVEVDAGGVGVDLLEADLAGVAGSRHALPGDAGVGLVGHDPRLPFLLPAADVRAPVEAVGCLAPDLLDPLHEGREALELPEQGVSLRHRHVDVHRFVECSYGSASLGPDGRDGADGNRPGWLRAPGAATRPPGPAGPSASPGRRRM